MHGTTMDGSNVGRNDVTFGRIARSEKREETESKTVNYDTLGK